LIGFGAAVTLLTQKMPRSVAGTHYARQMLRSGTAAAPNYAEARGAESRADFIHKMRIVLKELNETMVWVRMAVQSRLSSAELTTAIVAENQELCRIVAASIKTARGPGTTPDNDLRAIPDS
jgi:four helix bundle protein